MSAVKRLSIKELKVDKRYQRDLQEPRINKIVKNFDPRQLGVLEVSQSNGKASVIDGQHRLAALRKLKVDKVLCVVHSDLTAEEEAALFVRFQMDRQNLKAWERFRAQVFSGDPMANDIERIVQECGFKTGHATDDSSNFTIEAVVSLENIYRNLGPDMLQQTLHLIGRLWGGDDRSNNGYLIRGVALLLKDYGDRFSEEHEYRLRQVAPTTIIRRALGQDTYGGGDQAHKRISRELRKVAGLRGRPRKFKKSGA